ncbi:MAG: hypothetical protein KAU01_11965 [Candidatus Cloacimonetes bacterium]|nr:hypothetical protein [Candidatus Cloacimonadota bacterium]
MRKIILTIVLALTLWGIFSNELYSFKPYHEEMEEFSYSSLTKRQQIFKEFHTMMWFILYHSDIYPYSKGSDVLIDEFLEYYSITFTDLESILKEGDEAEWDKGTKKLTEMYLFYKGLEESKQGE